MGLERLHFEDAEEDEPRLGNLKVKATSPVGMVLGIVGIFIVPMFLGFVMFVTMVSISSGDDGTDASFNKQVIRWLIEGIVAGLIGCVLPAIGLRLSIRQLKLERTVAQPRIGTSVTGIVLNSVIALGCIGYLTLFVISLSNWG